MTTLEEIRKQFPRARFAPDPNCTKCHGNGTYDVPGKFAYLSSKGRPCLCLFFADKSDREWIRDAFKEIADDYDR